MPINPESTPKTLSQIPLETDRQWNRWEYTSSSNQGSCVEVDANMDESTSDATSHMRKSRRRPAPAAVNGDPVIVLPYADQEEKDMQFRKRPKTTPKAASASSSIDLSSTPSSSSDRSTWHLLTRDYIESITAFLTLREIAVTMMRTSKHWRAVVPTMRNRKDETKMWRNTLRILIESPRPIHRIVHGLIVEGGLSCTEVSTIGPALPHLRKLTVDLKDSYSDISRSTTPLQLPPQLESLTLWMNTHRDTSEPISTYVRAVRTVSLAVAQLHHLRSLTLGFSPFPVLVLPASALEPLLNLTALEILYFSGVPPLTPEITQLLCRFSCLTEHRSPIKWTPEGSDTLTSDRPERFRIINLAAVTITESYVPFISRCVNLRELDSTFEAVSFLPSLVHLEELVFHSTDVVDIPLAVAAIRSCVQLTYLHLEKSRFLSADVESMLSDMTKLKLLSIEGGSINSFSFLERLPHIQQSLISLNVSDCPISSVHEIHSLRCLKALNSLELIDCVPVDEYTIATMTRGEKEFIPEIWGHLQSFSYYFEEH